MVPGGTHRMNIWQSKVPPENLPNKNFYINGEYYIVPDSRSIHLLPPGNQQQYLTSDQDTNALQPVAGGEETAVRVVLEGEEKVLASIQVTHAFYSAGNSLDDGYEGTCPVDEYGPQNDFGLYNMAGNVWEWTADWWTTQHEVTFPTTVNPKGPPSGEKRVLKGGSFICNWLTCPRMRPSGRKGLPPDSGSDSLGFRCAADALPQPQPPPQPPPPSPSVGPLPPL
eukprot:TRINITY_DN837_c0_g1_i1.p1 TRINITY_DN837_c0_g1~~TRINITY_DN837_c0_g1_i1.p1  ORF type:complete len:225 (+),score=64.60 TRINITY_DN837_c0_g1_i1:449-1123(+)